MARVSLPSRHGEAGTGNTDPSALSTAHRCPSRVQQEKEALSEPGFIVRVPLSNVFYSHEQNW